MQQLVLPKHVDLAEELESDVAIEYGREFFSVEGVRVVHQVLRLARG